MIRSIFPLKNLFYTKTGKTMIEDKPLSDAQAYYFSSYGNCNIAEITFDHLTENSIPQNDVTWVTLQNLIGLALERSMKAFLAVRGVDPAELASPKYGHRLDRLLSSCIEKGIVAAGEGEGQSELHNALTRLIMLMGADYQSHNFRYLGCPRIALLQEENAVRTTFKVIKCILNLSSSEDRTLA